MYVHKIKILVALFYSFSSFPLGACIIFVSILREREREVDGYPYIRVYTIFARMSIFKPLIHELCKPILVHKILLN